MTVPEKAEAGREIARRKLAGEPWRTICADYRITRTTARKAARDYAEAQESPPEPLEALAEEDVDHILQLALRTTEEGLRRCREIIAQGRRDAITLGAVNSATRALSAIVWAMVRTGYLPNPADELTARRLDRMEKVYGVTIARLAERAGLDDAAFEAELERTAAEARLMGGLALAGTTNGKEP